jgi:Uma2 family endonuclease
LDPRGCIGAPALIVEIVSPGNTKKELKQKFEVYQESGVKEY